MKGVTSQDNLSVYFMRQRPKTDTVDITELNRRIKSIKAALKIAERHNEQLHMKIKHLKDNHQFELIKVQTECKKYKQLYTMLVENYELKNVEAKQYKKKIKKMQIEHMKKNREEQIETIEEENRQFKNTIMKQSKDLMKLQQQNRILYEQVYQKNAKIKQFQTFISKNNLASSRIDSKDKSMLNNLKIAIQTNSSQLQKIIQQRQQLLNLKGELQKINKDLMIKQTKTSIELEYQQKANQQYKERLSKLQKQIDKLTQENKTINQKYSQLLTFSLDLQKDFQKQLHTIAKELNRQDIIKVS